MPATVPSGPSTDHRARKFARRLQLRSPWLWFVVGFVIFDFWLVTTISSGTAPLKVPYAPTFVHQVATGNVASVNF